MAAANTVYMRTGLLSASGLDTFYAVQNASLSSSASIVVTYRNTDGTVKTTDGPYTVGPGGKKSITTCSPSSGAAMAQFSGSAVVESTGAPIAVIGKAQNSFAAGTPRPGTYCGPSWAKPAGTSKMALPFVRWAKDADQNAASNVGGKQRTFIAIQNLEATPIKVTVTYKDKNGTTVVPNAGGSNPQVITIPAFAKGNWRTPAVPSFG